MQPLTRAVVSSNGHSRQQHSSSRRKLARPAPTKHGDTAGAAASNDPVQRVRQSHHNTAAKHPIPCSQPHLPPATFLSRSGPVRTFDSIQFVFLEYTSVLFYCIPTYKLT